MSLQAYYYNASQQEDGSWVAWLVDAPEIYAYGRTKHEAVSILFLLLGVPPSISEVRV